MSEENTIQISDDVNEIVSHNSRDPHHAHNGKQISLVSLSPNGTYIVTYSEDDKSIEGWIVDNSKLIPDSQVNVPEESKKIFMIKVNDSKIVCFLCRRNHEVCVEIFQISNEHRPFKLNPKLKKWQPTIFFQKNGNLVINTSFKILIYSPHDEINDELILMSSCEISNNKGNFIDEDNNVWAISSNYLFHWDLETSRLKFSYSLGFTATHSKTNNKLTVMSKGNYILVKHYDEIAIFSKGVHFPIPFNSPEKYTINIIYDITDIYDIIDTNKQPVDASRMFNDENSENDYKNKFILCEYNSGSKKAFGLVDGKISCINLSDLNWHDFYESHKGEDDFIGWNNYLCQTAFEKNYCNDTLAFPDMESIRSLFSKEHKNIQQINFDNQKYKWKISQTTNKLLVYMDEKELCSINIFKKQNSSKFQELKWKILNNNALALLDNKTIKIFEYNNNKESIKIQYKFRRNSGLKVKEFSGPILPIMSDVKKDFLIEIISSIIEDERCLAKYGPTLLPNLIKSSDPELTRYIKDIYNKCMKLVKEDPKRNLKFLNIITSSMNDLHKKYPDHITKFNSEMFMLLDPFNEKIDDNDYSHFYPFCQEIKIDYCYYPFEYSGWKEIFYPQSSVFTDTCKKEFYTSWNVASYPTLSITRDVRINLYQTSIAFGFFHIIFELRQFIWNPKKYFSSIWNLFDISAYLSVTITSIYYIKNDVTVVTPEWALSISCLLLDLKFLLFFKIFESFGVYFAIIFGVAKRVFSFLVVLAIIILSFAHAFFLLLHPEKLLDSLKAQNPNDSNNPWTLSNTYNQTDENGKILNETLIQVPGENTNLFYSYSTSLLATYLFLTGSQNSFSPWSPDPTSIGNLF
uniref:Ion transport domain-containing protein n=1 Tax=Rhizophagus irregularis (strain DAOM 181602 / DAOM 197198 / MUCL 43194) TaxID=747089 RepID=U9UU22_RHIID